MASACIPHDVWYSVSLLFWLNDFVDVRGYFDCAPLF